MGHRNKKEIAMRIHRYLNHPTPTNRPFTVDGYELPASDKEAAVTPDEQEFEEAIVCIYANRPRYRTGLSILMQKNRLLDLLFGSHDERIFRYSFRHYDDQAETCRKDYQQYLQKDFYRNSDSRCSKYNEHMLETLLSPEQWEALQVYKLGSDHIPASPYEDVTYTKVWEEIPTPPPAVAEWLAEVGRTAQEEAFSVG